MEIAAHKVGTKPWFARDGNSVVCTSLFSFHTSAFRAVLPFAS